MRRERARRKKGHRHKCGNYGGASRVSRDVAARQIRLDPRGNYARRQVGGGHLKFPPKRTLYRRPAHTFHGKPPTHGALPFPHLGAGKVDDVLVVVDPAEPEGEELAVKSDAKKRGAS